MSKKLSEQQMESIVTRVFVYSEKRSSVAKDLNVSENVISNLLTAFTLVRDRNFDELLSRINRGNAYPSHIDWAARRLNVEYPKKEIEEAYRNRLNRDDARRRARIGEAQNDSEEVAQESVQEEKKTTVAANENLFLVKIIEALNTQNELLEQLMDVVMPKYCGDMKDNINTNTDVICERIKNCEQSLEKIAYNSRKRGL